MSEFRPVPGDKEGEPVSVTPDERTSEMLVVPRHPTKEMVAAAWASALDENAAGVWEAMITAWLHSKMGNSETGSG